MFQESFKTKFEEFIRHTGELGETGIRLGKLSAVQKTADISSRVATRIVLLFLVLMVVLFCSVAAACWIGNSLHSAALGFLLVGAIYLVLAIVLIIVKKNLVLPFLRNQVVKMIYKKKK